jgi:hypothetical protein
MTSLFTPLEVRVEVERPHKELDHEPEGDSFYEFAGRVMNGVATRK